MSLSQMLSRADPMQPSGPRRIVRRQTAINLGEPIFDIEVVPSSLVEIAPILRVANEVEAASPCVTYLSHGGRHIGHLEGRAGAAAQGGARGDGTPWGPVGWRVAGAGKCGYKWLLREQYVNGSTRMTSMAVASSDGIISKMV
ncbi:uncharacterized protein LOC119293472 [Triticum dicoccoides]|uniref:uncharacterized protein LOC119293472 n=1 Tax=Triticum dicoccoides TaxID=85692 RepID=UPI0018905ED9|nr:uncharacterized protein LOC119293472 [Triticum dicoccoides]